MTGDFEFAADDEAVVGSDAVGYRVILDLSGADANLMDDASRRSGLQPTQVLTEALRLYARRHERNANVQAISHLSDALHRSTATPARARARRSAA